MKSSADAAADLSAPLHPRAWMTVCLLWPVALLNYLDRQMLSTMRLSMQVDITELQRAENFGRLMAVFMWVYAVCSPLGGMLADRMNRKWVVVMSLAVWSAVTLLMGTAGTFDGLYWLRAAMGVSEALYIPAGLALIVDYHRGPTRSIAVGLHMSGLYLGQALGGVGGWVAQDVSWRTAFTGCGGIGIVYAVVLIFLLREHRVESRSPRAPGASDAAQDGSADWVGFALLMVFFAPQSGGLGSEELDAHVASRPVCLRPENLGVVGDYFHLGSRVLRGVHWRKALRSILPP